MTKRKITLLRNELPGGVRWGARVDIPPDETGGGWLHVWLSGHPTEAAAREAAHSYRLRKGG